MHAELHAYQRGDITFGRFVVATRKTWRALATHLLGRWKAPPGVSVEDMEQELLLACWRVIPKWEPGKAALVRFVVYNCCDKAKKWLHKQRNAYRRDDKSPSRFPTSLAALGLEEHVEERLMAGVSTPALAEDEMVRREALLSVPSDDLPFMLYQQSGSIERAAAAIQGNATARFVLHSTSMDAARAMVERSIERAVEAVSGAA